MITKLHAPLPYLGGVWWCGFLSRPQPHPSRSDGPYLGGNLPPPFHAPLAQSYFSSGEVLGRGKASKGAKEVPGWKGGLPPRLEQMSGCAQGIGRSEKEREAA